MTPTRLTLVLILAAALIAHWWGLATLFVVLAILTLWFLVAMGCAYALGAAIRLRDHR